MNVAQMEHARTLTDAVRCSICGEALRDPESIRKRIGPVCAGKLSRFIAAAGTSVEEIAALGLVADPTAARWMRCVAGAIADGRLDRARMFLAYARRAAELARAEALQAA